MASARRRRAEGPAAPSALAGLLGMVVGLLAVGVIAFAVIELRRLCGLE